MCNSKMQTRLELIIYAKLPKKNVGWSVEQSLPLMVDEN